MDGCFIPRDHLFLGFDSSTQSLKATILDSNLAVVGSELVHFDSDLPQYGTKDGVYRDPNDDGRIVSPTLMWVEALDLILEKLKSSGLDFGKIAAVSGSGQQHGSVYWKKGSLGILGSLDPEKKLAGQLGEVFSIKESPIWMDCSTTAQCRQIETAVGGAMELSRITGSRAYERFTGPQIRKIFQQHPDVYNNTERISLVSSFMASLFIGAHACIDHTDGAGMNLLDIRQKDWSNLALEATAPGLAEKLGNVVAAHEVAGPIAPYFVKRYGFNINCLAIHWSGDNPNSLAGLTLSTPGDLAISLGTSDTVFGIVNDPKPGLEGHVFPNSVDINGYMVMLCYKNGSLTREDVRNNCAAKSWETFNTLLEQAPPLNDGKIGYYYKDHEILPPLPVGCHRYVLKDFSKTSMDGLCQEVKDFDPSSEIRALVEGQFLSMRGHAERFGLPCPPERIIATGGASANEALLRVIASVFGCDVHTVERSDSASLGAALRAAHGWKCFTERKFVPIASLYREKLDRSSLSSKLSAKAGDRSLFSAYTSLMNRRLEIEYHLVEKLGR